MHGKASDYVWGSTRAAKVVMRAIEQDKCPILSRMYYFCGAISTGMPDLVEEAVVLMIM